MLIVIAGKIHDLAILEQLIASLFHEIPENKLINVPAFVEHLPANPVEVHNK